MKTTQILMLRFIIALLLEPLASLYGADAPALRPNIIYILADDMGYADAGFMGCQDIKTPNLEKLGRDGTILKSFYAQPVCSPTRAALMTGRYAVRTGVYTVVTNWGLKLEERTLAQALREAGYETAIVGKWHLGAFEEGYRPINRGFDHQYGLWGGVIDYFTHKSKDKPDWHRNDQPCDDQGYSTHLLAKEACRIIREKQPDKPLFLYLPFNAVHSPFQAPDEYLKPYATLKGGRRIYAGMCAAMDEAIGQVLAALDEKNIRDNTLIIFSSDNGGPMPGRVTSNGPLRAGKGTIYEGGVRVCASVNWPGRIPAGAVINEPLHAVDWFPTLVKLAGGSLEPKLTLDGRDIWPVLTQGAKSPHDTLLLCGTVPACVALRAGDWKLLLNAKEKDAEEAPADEPGSMKVELYNLASDIGEQKNLAAEQPEKVNELRAQLDALMKTAVAPGQGTTPQRKKQK